ncbi:hypothetical protein [Enterocloster citroniae]|nr:hypothetical protein [Enterocloster citroniae]
MSNKEKLLWCIYAGVLILLFLHVLHGPDHQGKKGRRSCPYP